MLSQLEKEKSMNNLPESDEIELIDIEQLEDKIAPDSSASYLD